MRAHNARVSDASASIWAGVVRKAAAMGAEVAGGEEVRATAADEDSDLHGAESFCRRYMAEMTGLGVVAALKSPTDDVRLPRGKPFAVSLRLVIGDEDAPGVVHSDAQAAACVLAEIDDLVQCFTLDGEEAGCSLAFGGPKIFFNYAAPGSDITTVGLNGKELGTVKPEAMQALLDGDVDDMVKVRWGGPDGDSAWLSDLRESTSPATATISVGEHVLAWNLTSAAWGIMGNRFPETRFTVY
jgi:hypothetical protein